MENKVVMEAARKEWRKKGVEGLKGVVLATKLKAVKHCFKSWQRSVKGADSTLSGLDEKMEALESVAKASGWLDTLREPRRILLAETWKVLIKEERD